MTRNTIANIAIAATNSVAPSLRAEPIREIELALLAATGPGDGIEIAPDGQAFDAHGSTSIHSEVTLASVLTWLTDRQAGRVLAAKYPDLAVVVGGNR